MDTDVFGLALCDCVLGSLTICSFASCNIWLRFSLFESYLFGVQYLDCIMVLGSVVDCE